jgi:hypothetical protein
LGPGRWLLARAATPVIPAFAASEPVRTREAGENCLSRMCPSLNTLAIFWLDVGCRSFAASGDAGCGPGRRTAAGGGPGGQSSHCGLTGMALLGRVERRRPIAAGPCG